MSKLFKSAYDVIIDDIIGDTTWHGETNFDNESYKNVENAWLLIDKLLDKVKDNADLPENAVATASGQKLSNQAKRIIRRVKDQLGVE